MVNETSSSKKGSKTSEMAQDIVRSHIMYSLAAGMVPIPLLDIAAVTVVQLDMLRQLAKLYDKDFKESQGKSFISALSGTALARFGASFMKSVPVIGSILGGVTMAVLSGASTYAVGQVFIYHFSEGKDLADINLESAREMYREQFEKGKQVAKEMEILAKQQMTEEDDVFKKIEKLSVFRDKGLITEEDFQKQKERLLDQV